MKKKILSNKVLKIFFLGSGNIFQKHYSAIKKLNSFLEIAGIYKEKFKNNLIKKKYLDKVKNSDIVTILTPSGMHKQNIDLAIKYKKHIIVEKPICLKLKEIDDLISKKVDNKIFTIFQNRFINNVIQFKELIIKKKLGKCFLISARTYWNRDKSYYQKNKWRGTWAFDGGVATNQAIHIIDLIYWIFGDVNSVFARSLKTKAYIEAEDTIIISLKLKSGAIANLEFTTASINNNYENSITVLGKNGLAKIYGKNFENFDFQNLKKKYKNIKDNSDKNLHLTSYKHIISSILKKKRSPFLANLRDARKSLELLSAIYLSIEKKKEIFLPLKKYPKIKLGRKS